ncbi:MAG: helix-turn-helix domain-containing protein [Tissierellia bacterium]|nr:helix-turn-helix domain-containing protein [Tissierellia bacterium]
MDEINKIVAENLREIRRLRKLSLEGLAELTGVSKSMLGQIEREESNPTLQTLWKIAAGLRVSLTSLIVAMEPQAQLIKKADIQPMVEDQGSFKIYPICPFDAEKRYEVLSISLQAGARSLSEPHEPGTEELILVNNGTLELELSGKTYLIGPGDAFKFKSDKKHIYMNKTDKELDFTNIIYYPNLVEEINE